MKYMTTMTSINRDIADEVPVDSELKTYDRLIYDLDSFEGVLGKGDGLSVMFWIARILDVVKSKASSLKCLGVGWYEFKGEGCLYRKILSLILFRFLLHR